MTKMPKTEIRECEECGKPFKVSLPEQGRPRRFHARTCARKNWDARHPRVAVPE